MTVSNRETLHPGFVFRDKVSSRTQQFLPSESSRDTPLQPATHTTFRNRASSRSGPISTTSAVRTGRGKKGVLEQSDPVNSLRRGRYADTYRLKGIRTGRQIHIKVNSNSFDTYVQLLDRRTGQLLLDNDDGQSGNTNSRLTFIAKRGIQYALRISSFARKETGTYKLRVKSFTPMIQGFDYSYGHGLINAAAAVNAVIHRPAGSPAAPDRPSLSDSWNLNQIKVPEVWARGYTGKNVVVAVIDSGVDIQHADLARNIWHNAGEIPDNGIDDDRNGFVDDINGWDFVDGDRQPNDANGHGTFVSGLIAGIRNDFGVTGVAPDAKIMPIRVLDRQGSGTQRDTAAGIRYAAQMGADIINLSLGGPPGIELTPRLQRAIEFAYSKGVFIAIAAGNERQSLGATRAGEPAYWAATHNLALTVGATDIDLQVADYSNPSGNHHANRMVVAPGDAVSSIVPWYEQRVFSGSGTSFATPHVAGVAALMLSANPNLTPAQMMAILTQTANPAGITVV